MADDFKYDPEEETDKRRARMLRLPFALCKKNNIKIEEWWTPRDAWSALTDRGIVDNPSEEMKKLLKEKKQRAAKRRREEKKIREKQKREQLADPIHTPEKNPNPGKDYIANVKKGRPMTHKQADSGNVNPFFGKHQIGYDENCQTCVPTYLARLQGFDVHALPNLNNRAIYDLSRNPFSIYKKNGESIRTYRRGYGKTNISFVKERTKEGGIYQIAFGCKDKDVGHTVLITRNGGKLKIYDPQINEEISSERNIRKYLSLMSHAEISEDLTGVTIDKKIADAIMKGEVK